MAGRILSDIISNEKTTKQESFPNEQVDTMQDVSMPRTFLSKNIHSSTTSEDLSERWVLTISQTELIIKATANKLTRSALMKMAQRYRADRMFDIHMIHGTMYTDTIDAISKSIHDEKYCQVFGNNKYLWRHIQ